MYGQSGCGDRLCSKSACIQNGLSAKNKILNEKKFTKITKKCVKTANRTCDWV